MAPAVRILIEYLHRATATPRLECTATDPFSLIALQEIMEDVSANALSTLAHPHVVRAIMPGMQS